MAVRGEEAVKATQLGGNYWEPEPGEEIVISGIAGRFPSCENMQELHEKLNAKVDLVSDRCRWNTAYADVPNRMGMVHNLDKFDATFFGIHGKQAETMDPMARSILEHTFEAIMEAGYNPAELRGKKIGVFYGICFSESEKTWFYERVEAGGLGITGCSRALFANRISYCFDFHGPSLTIDTACSSSMTALDLAYRSIRLGQCDAAIVSGSNICLQPHISLQFMRLGVLSPEGTCKTFDESANGYVRSEAIAAMFLQKKKDARRIYSTLVYTKTNCDGFKEQSITFPSARMQQELLHNFYQECRLSPQIVSYLECHGTGTAIGDPEELQSIATIYAPTKDRPLLIGSVKSNLGHTEPASGICGIAKVILAMETGVIGPNLHYNKPRNVPGLLDGSFRVITEPTPWDGEYAAVNSFGFGGVNCHALLKANPKRKKNNGLPADDLPRVVTVSGRTTEAVDILLKQHETRPMDVELIHLYHRIYSINIPANMFRGYTVVSPKAEPNTVPIRDIANIGQSKRPLFFCFSGMGSQWQGMGEALLRFPIFAKAIQKCDAVLRPRGIKIVDVITSKQKGLFDNVLNSFVGIAAIQIGLVDLLTAAGIVPDNLIGHSVGELGCAYADGSFTAEQMVLAAYSRGVATNETELITGAMAAVGLGYDAVKNLCPPDIEVACHNSGNSSTISGPAESVRKFVAELQGKNVFAKEVASSNVAYHSRYIKDAAPKLLSYLKKVIPNPKRRSEKWLSTSVPESDWSKPETQLCSAEYHTNNLLSPVLFEETAKLIPEDAIVIEIAPHGLLQAILKRSLNQSVSNVPLTQRDHRDNAEFFVQALGKLHNLGVQVQPANIYPPVELPVSRSTPMISPYIRWDHTDDWFVSYYDLGDKMNTAERQFRICLDGSQNDYMAGHVIDHRALIPATFYLYLAWDTFSKLLGQSYEEVPVVFENVRFERATAISDKTVAVLTIVVHHASGKFEITEGTTLVVSGTVRSANPAKERMPTEYLPTINDEEVITKKAFYKELRLRGYNYSGLFRGVEHCSLNGSRGRLAWFDNFVAFMDTMLQVQIMRSKARFLRVPTSIRKVLIDPKRHMSIVNSLPEDDKTIPVFSYPEFKVVLSGGIEIHDLETMQISRRRQLATPVIDEYMFVPYRDNAETPLAQMARLCVDTVNDIELIITLKMLELVERDQGNATPRLLTPVFVEQIENIPLANSVPTIIAEQGLISEKDVPPKATIIEPSKIPADGSLHIALGQDLLTLSKVKAVLPLLNALTNTGYMFTAESVVDEETYENARNLGLYVIFEKRCQNETFMLLRKRQKAPSRIDVVRVDNENFDWIERVGERMKDESGDAKLVLVSNDPESGVIGFVNCARREPSGVKLQAVLIFDKCAPEFNLENPLYTEQLDLDLPVNVLRGKVWGAYRHAQLPPLQPRPCHHVYARQTKRGDLSSLHWSEGPFTADKIADPTNELIKVEYAALNFKDVMIATGKLSLNTISLKSDRYDSLLGIEACGINSKGERVMEMLAHSGISNYVETTLAKLQVPDHWTMKEAATVPCVYYTVVEALYIRARMKKGQKILVHSGTGGVGQAAINLALAEGCEVFTTVGTYEKRRFIKELFPSIDDDHIGNSRDTSFEAMIMKMTNGQGVDLVLNSLAEEKLAASVRCLAGKGVFLEIGKYDIGMNTPLGLNVFQKEISFCGVMLDSLLTIYPHLIPATLGKVEELLNRGVVKPIISKCFEMEQLEEAFRYMAAGRHVGKVLIKIRHGEDGALPLAYPRYHCRPDRSYVLIGGLGGLGLELSDWLLDRGARNFVFVSRKGIVTDYQLLRVETLKAYGANTVILSGLDASKRSDCEKILRTAADMAPVDGIFNLAANLKDLLLVNQTKESFEESVKPKAWITKRLDELSRTLCPKLRHFVVFSSVSCGRGNPGQTNYGFANSVMERICERRREEGLPGLAIQWGAVGDVGLLGDKQETDEELSVSGTLQQRLSSCLEELDKFLSQDRPIVASMVVAEKASTGSAAENAVEAVLSILGIKNIKNVNLQTPLTELGLDSMMAVEIKQVFERDFDLYYSLQEIRNLSLAKLLASSSSSPSDANAEQEKPEGNNRTAEYLLFNVPSMLEILTKGGESYSDVPTLATDKSTQVFMISGFDADTSIYSNIWPKLKFPAACIRLLLDSKYDTIQQEAAYFLKYIVEAMKNRERYIIVAYSFGCFLGMELNKALEKLGYKGRLILIDGAPEYMRSAMDTIPKVTGNREDDTNFMLMASLNVPVTQEIVTAMSSKTTLEEKLELAFNTWQPETSQIPSLDAYKLMSKILHKRFNFLDSQAYQPELFQAPVTLLKASIPFTANISPHYGLEKLALGSIDVYTIQGDHRSMLADEKIAMVINADSTKPSEEPKGGQQQRTVTRPTTDKTRARS